MVREVHMNRVQSQQSQIKRIFVAKVAASIHTFVLKQNEKVKCGVVTLKSSESFISFFVIFHEL